MELSFRELPLERSKLLLEPLLGGRGLGKGSAEARCEGPHALLHLRHTRTTPITPEHRREEQDAVRADGVTIRARSAGGHCGVASCVTPWTIATCWRMVSSAVDSSDASSSTSPPKVRGMHEQAPQAPIAPTTRCVGGGGGSLQCKRARASACKHAGSPLPPCSCRRRRLVCFR